MKIAYLLAVLLTSCAVGSDQSNASADVAGAYSYTLTRDALNPGTCAGNGAPGSSTLTLSDNADGSVSILEFQNSTLNVCYNKITDSKFFSYCKLDHTNVQLDLVFTKNAFTGQWIFSEPACFENYLVAGSRK